MKNLKFRYVKAQNILCFGEAGVEIHFTDYGNVVQIKGENFDYPGTPRPDGQDDPASNASGKSSVQELLTVALFGKTVKSPTKLKGGSVINTLADKGFVEVQWDEYRVLRTFRRAASGSVTSKLDVWESPDLIWDDDSKKTKGKSFDTQKWIDERIGLNHHAFCNVVVFDDSNSYSFLESDTPTKREFVENLLGLDQYREYHETAKNFLKEQKKAVEKLSLDYELAQNRIAECDTRLTKLQGMERTWTEAKKAEVKNLLVQIQGKQKQLEQTDGGALLAKWEKAQERLQAIETDIETKQTQRNKIVEALAAARPKLDQARTQRESVAEKAHSHNITMKSWEGQLTQHTGLVVKLQSLEEGTRCPTCHGTINSENYGSVLTHELNAAEGCRANIQKEKQLAEAAKAEMAKRSAAITVMEDKIGEAERKQRQIEVEINQLRSEAAQLAKLSKPDGNLEQRLLESQIVDLKKQLTTKKAEYEGDSPYKEIIEQTLQERAAKEQERQLKGTELEAAEEEVPYYEYWVHAFGDRGIRKYVIDGIIPALNARIGYWMQYLIENKIELVFDNELEATISRNGNPVDYYGTSNGERRRINLAVSQAFAYVMMLNSGTCPSLVFLDEITGGGIDRAGVIGVYNMIFELAKERQVLVTTHNENLISMLQGCQEIKLRKKNDVTQLV